MNGAILRPTEVSAALAATVNAIAAAANEASTITRSANGRNVIPSYVCMEDPFAQTWQAIKDRFVEPKARKRHRRASFSTRRPFYGGRRSNGSTLLRGDFEFGGAFFEKKVRRPVLAASPVDVFFQWLFSFQRGLTAA